MAGLQRFIDAQENVYDDVVAELARGRKTSHWMWFIFPQLRGLGRSETARYFGIEGPEEATAYAAHPILGERLRACSRLLLDLPDQPIRDVMGSPDDMKLRSSMTLFAQVAPAEPLFGQVLAKFFVDGPDERTLALLRGR